MSGLARSASSADPKPPQRIRIDSHRSLLARRKQLVRALATDPARGRLLFANAALAFKDAGVDLGPAIADHVLHTVRQSAEATTRREVLTAQLRKALTVVPHPSDPEWLAHTLFERIKLSPLAIGRREPTYLPAIPAGVEADLRGLLVPSSRPRLPARTGGKPPPPPPVARLDLDAEVPPLRPARRAPASVTLPQLWFYLPSHDLVRPLLQLGILEVSVLPTLTPTQFRAVQAGKPVGGFIDWVERVTFPDERVSRTR